MTVTGNLVLGLSWCPLVSRCWPVDDHGFYGFRVRSGETKKWTHMVTMDVESCVLGGLVVPYGR